MITSELYFFPQRKYSVNLASSFTYNFGLKRNFSIRKTATEISQKYKAESVRFVWKTIFLTLKNEFFIKNHRKTRYLVQKMTITEQM